jgi:hypothetical protein
MPLEEFRRRHKEHVQAGWTPILPRQEVLIAPSFETKFDAFAANVAHELRHYIVYRTDRGRFARGLVRASQQLEVIHDELRQANHPSGQRVTIAAALYRRTHPQPTSRWMMSIQFGRAVAVPPPARTTPTTRIGGRKVCIHEEERSCREYEKGEETDKKSCDDGKGTWTFDCPTENLIGTRKGKFWTTKYYKPGYFDADDAKWMCNMADDVFTPAT